MMDNTEIATVLCTLASLLLFEVPIVLSDGSDEDGSCDEDEAIILLISRKRKWNKPQRIPDYVERVLPGFTARQFQEHFRMSVQAYQHLLNVVGPQLTKDTSVGRPVISVEASVICHLDSCHA